MLFIFFINFKIYGHGGMRIFFLSFIFSSNKELPVAFYNIVKTDKNLKTSS